MSGEVDKNARRRLWVKTKPGHDRGEEVAGSGRVPEIQYSHNILHGPAPKVRRIGRCEFFNLHESEHEGTVIHDIASDDDNFFSKQVLEF